MAAQQALGGEKDRLTRIQPDQLPTVIKQCLNLNRVDREISRDLRDGEAHIRKRPE